MTNDDIREGLHKLVAEVTASVSTFESKLDKAARDGYVGDLYRTDYLVRGRGPFPIDMLRYTCSWPKDESSAAIIQRTIEAITEDSLDVHQVALSKYHRDPLPQLATDRWEAKFQWTVVRLVETVRL
jgi:hypothetical protein